MTRDEQDELTRLLKEGGMPALFIPGVLYFVEQLLSRRQPVFKRCMGCDDASSQYDALRKKIKDLL